MDWMEIVEQIFELAVFPVLSIVGVYLTYLIKVKVRELQQKADNDTADKYLAMLGDTISSVVTATTQTYVEGLKQQGKFDAEAQKAALELTRDTVMRLLTEDAVKYITTSVGDLDTYVTNKIEAEVRLQNKY
jgi:hypothetical protein